MFPLPFMINSPIIEYPWSGNVTQDIETSWFAQMKGIPEVEREIVTKVWSYGEQLGQLTDVLLEVVEKLDLKSEAVTELQAKAAEMKTARDDVIEKIEERITRAEADLKRVSKKDD